MESLIFNRGPKNENGIYKNLCPVQSQNYITNISPQDKPEETCNIDTSPVCDTVVDRFFLPRITMVRIDRASSDDSCCGCVPERRTDRARV